jgi:hypothetical protein
MGSTIMMTTTMPRRVHPMQPELEPTPTQSPQPPATGPRGANRVALHTVDVALASLDVINAMSAVVEVFELCRSCGLAFSQVT